MCACIRAMVADRRYQWYVRLRAVFVCFDAPYFSVCLSPSSCTQPTLNRTLTHSLARSLFFRTEFSLWPSRVHRLPWALPVVQSGSGGGGGGGGGAEVRVILCARLRCWCGLRVGACVRVCVGERCSSKRVALLSIRRLCRPPSSPAMGMCAPKCACLFWTACLAYRVVGGAFDLNRTNSQTHVNSVICLRGYDPCLSSHREAGWWMLSARLRRPSQMLWRPSQMFWRLRARLRRPSQMFWRLRTRLRRLRARLRRLRTRLRRLRTRLRRLRARLRRPSQMLWRLRTRLGRLRKS
jgi:hypothetical protein